MDFPEKSRIVVTLEAADAIFKAQRASQGKVRWHPSCMAELEQTNEASYDQIIGRDQRGYT
jgi:hypothetical protein